MTVTVHRYIQHLLHHVLLVDLEGHKWYYNNRSWFFGISSAERSWKSPDWEPSTGDYIISICITLNTSARSFCRLQYKQLFVGLFRFWVFLPFDLFHLTQPITVLWNTLCFIVILPEFYSNCCVFIRMCASFFWPRAADGLFCYGWMSIMNSYVMPDHGW